MTNLTSEGETFISQWANWSRKHSMSLEPKDTALGKVVKEGGFLPPTQGKRAEIYMPPHIEAIEGAMCRLKQANPESAQAIINYWVKGMTKGKAAKRLRMNHRTLGELLEFGYRYVAREVMVWA